MNAAALDVVVVNWNTRALCRALLTTLAPLVHREPGVSVILVDNGSTDGSADAVARDFPWVRLLRSPENLGYARGNNLGIAAGDAPYVWLLNSDTEVRDIQAPLRLLAFLRAQPQCGAVAPALVLPDGALQTGAGGRDIGLLSAFHYSFFLSRFFPRLCPGYFLDQAYWSKSEGGVPVDWVCGAALMAPRAALEAVGLVPADQFMYAEDVKLCRLLRERGYTVAYLPSVAVTHHHGASTPSADTVSTRWVQAVLDEYGARVGVVRRALMRAILSAGFFLRGALYLLIGAAARRRSARAKSAAMWAYGAASLRHRLRASGRA